MGFGLAEIKQEGSPIIFDKSHELCGVEFMNRIEDKESSYAIRQLKCGLMWCSGPQGRFRQAINHIKNTVIFNG